MSMACWTALLVLADVETDQLLQAAEIAQSTGDFALLDSLRADLNHPFSATVDWRLDRPESGKLILESGMTLLMRAAQQGQYAIVQYLLEHGADFSLADDSGATALMHVSQHWRLRLMEDPDSDSAIAAYVQDRDAHDLLNVLATLLFFGANLPHKPPKGVASHWEEQWTDLRKLIGSVRAELLDGLNPDEMTPSAFSAARYGFVAILRRQLVSGMSPDAHLRKTGDSLLMIASVSAQDEVVRLLLEHGADISASVQGKTALVGATCSHLQGLPTLGGEGNNRRRAAKDTIVTLLKAGATLPLVRPKEVPTETCSPFDWQAVYIAVITIQFEFWVDLMWDEAQVEQASTRILARMQKREDTFSSKGRCRDIDDALLARFAFDPRIQQLGEEPDRVPPNQLKSMSTALQTASRVQHSVSTAFVDSYLNILDCIEEVFRDHYGVAEPMGTSASTVVTMALAAIAPRVAAKLVAGWQKDQVDQKLNWVAFVVTLLLLLGGAAYLWLKTRRRQPKSRRTDYRATADKAAKAEKAAATAARKKPSEDEKAAMAAEHKPPTVKAKKKAGRERAEKNKCEPEERAAVKAASRRKRVGEKPAEVQRAEAAWTVTGDALHRSLGASAGAFPEALNEAKDFFAMKIRAPTPTDRRTPTEPCVTRACCGWQSRLIVASRCATWRATCGRVSRRRRGFRQPAVGTLTRGQRRRWSGRLLS